MVDPGSRPAEAAGLRIDAVEVLPTDLRSVLLRVAGAWEGPPPERLAAPVLVLPGPGRGHRIDALPETSGAAARAAPETHPFRAAFSVPDALATLLDEGVELDLGPLTVRIPAPTPLGEEADADDAEGTVVDRAVLAERRARRAELAEEANLQRAGEAENTAATLEGELGKLELRLAAAEEERAAVAARLAAHEREAAEAGERRRELDARERDLRHRGDEVARGERETAAAREELSHAMARANGMRLELEALRREIDSAAARDLVRLEAEATTRAQALAAAQQGIAEARETIADARTEFERERAERVTAEAALHERRDAERTELESARARIGALERSMAERGERESTLAAVHDRLQRSLAALQAELVSARAEAERQARERDGLAAERDALATERDALAMRLAEEQPAPAPVERVRRPATRAAASPWLRDALRRLARADEAAAGQLALQLLPGQSLEVSGALDYDVEAPGLGTHRVTVRPGAGELASLTARRGRRTSDFWIAATPAGLVDLVVDGGAARPAGVRAAGTLRRRRALRRLPAVPLRLGVLARAGVLPDPGLLYRAVAESVYPEWTRGHRFTIALEIAGPRGGNWHVTAADGAPLVVREARPGAADAVVRMSQTAFQHLLDGEAPPAGEKPAMRGDAAAIGLLAQWTDRARWPRRRRGSLGAAPS